MTMCSLVRTFLQTCGQRRILTFHYLLMAKFYAVRRGKIPGVYSTWDECKIQVTGFKNASFKKFATENDAWSFVMDVESVFPEIAETTADTDTKNIEVSTSAEPPPTTTTTCLPNFTMSAARIKIQNETDQLYHLGKRKGDTSSLPKIYAKKAKIVATAGFHTTSTALLPNQSANSSKRASKKPAEKKSVYEKFNVLTVNDPVDPDSVKVYTDGACTKNGKYGARAGIGVYWGPDHPWNVSEKLQGRQTNNRAEIFAAVKAITQAKSNGISNITVYTDSKFLICSITAWIKKWKKNGWKLSTGGPVKNAQDFITLDNALTGMDVKWVYIRGHAGFAGNEEADRLAREGINK